MVADGKRVEDSGGVVWNLAALKHCSRGRAAAAATVWHVSSVEVIGGYCWVCRTSTFGCRNEARWAPVQGLDGCRQGVQIQQVMLLYQGPGVCCSGGLGCFCFCGLGNLHVSLFGSKVGRAGPCSGMSCVWLDC